MIKFELKFKNKPVKAHIKDDGGAALYFENDEWLLLERAGTADKYRITGGNFSPAKEDLALLGKLLYNGLKEYDRTHHFLFASNGKKQQ